jgi:hypothetical protein
MLPKLQVYGGQAVLLMQICSALNNHHSPEPFYISCRVAGKHIGCNHTHAAKLLKLFVSEGWLVVVHHGTGKKATRYKLRI